MELVLNVYNGDEIEKTYNARTCRLRMGTCEDILEIMSDEKMVNMDNLSDAEMLELMPMILRIFKTAKTVITQVFPDMTDDEYDRLDPMEVFQFVMTAFGYTFGQFSRASSKN